MAFERIQGRGRAEESNLSLGDLNRLHQLHEDWLGNVQEVDGIPVSQATPSKRDINTHHHLYSQVTTIEADEPLYKLEEEYFTCIGILWAAEG